MGAFLFVAAGAVLVVGLLVILYIGTHHSKATEIGRKSEVDGAPRTPDRTNGGVD